jgi:tRNA (cytidine56-2'-O)-methyltransferase
MITVLRLGHRAGRDPRISTHVSLVARAFGAGSIIYSGEHDGELEESVRKIVGRWGGDFSIRYEKSWRKVMSGFRGKTVHATMYGIPLDSKIGEIRRSKDVLVIVGGQKVPGEVYHSADYNVSITTQPHSEVAALAVLLHELRQGKELDDEFAGAKIRVIPQERGKKTAEAGKDI